MIIRFGLSLWRFLERRYPLDVDVQDGIDAAAVAQENELCAYFTDRPAAVGVAGTSPGAVSEPLTPAPGQPEPTEELLLAAANQIDDYRRHTHFNHPRQEYLCVLVRDLRDRAALFAQNR